MSELTPVKTVPIAKTIPVAAQKLYALVKIESTVGDYEKGALLPDSIPRAAKTAWLNSGRAEYR